MRHIERIERPAAFQSVTRSVSTRSKKTVL